MPENLGFPIPSQQGDFNDMPTNAPSSASAAPSSDGSASSVPQEKQFVPQAYDPNAATPYQAPEMPQAQAQDSPLGKNEASNAQNLGAVNHVGGLAVVGDRILQGFMKGRAMAQMKQAVDFNKKAQGLQGLYNNAASQYQKAMIGGLQFSDNPEDKARMAQLKSQVDTSYSALMDLYGEHVEGKGNKGKKKNADGTNTPSLMQRVGAALKGGDPAEVASSWYNIAKMTGPTVYLQTMNYASPKYKEYLEQQNQRAAGKDSWEIVSGAAGPNGELIQTNKATGETRIAKTPDGVTRVDKPTVGTRKLGSQVGDLNSAMERQWQILHKGQPLPPEYKLGDDATEEDYKQKDALLQKYIQTEGTAEQRAQAETDRARAEADRLAMRRLAESAEKGTWGPIKVDDGKGGEMTVLFNNKTKQTAPAPPGMENFGIAERNEAAMKKVIEPIDVATKFTDKYMASKKWSGPDDQALQDQFFEITKPSSGFRMTGAQIKLLNDLQSVAGKTEAWLHKQRYGTLYSDEQRDQIANTIKEVAQAKRAAIQEQYFGAATPSSATSPPSAEQSDPDPSKHVFDAGAWATANPKGDVKAAIAKAKAKGYEVTNAPN